MELIAILKVPNFSAFIGEYGAIGVFLWFLTFDNLTPIPAEISLITIGYLSASHVFPPIPATIASIAGFLTVDLIYLVLTKSGSKIVNKLTKKVGNSFIERYKKKMQKHMPRTLIILIFIPRMRMFGPILAGLISVTYKRFIFYDSIGLIGFCSLFVALGYFFHSSLNSVFTNVGKADNIIFIVFLLLLSAAIIFFAARYKKKES